MAVALPIPDEAPLKYFYSIKYDNYHILYIPVIIETLFFKQIIIEILFKIKITLIKIDKSLSYYNISPIKDI